MPRDRIDEQPPINFTPIPGAEAYPVRAVSSEVSNTRVPFGKCRGQLLSEVTARDLAWLNSKCSPGFLKNQIVRELNRRESAKSPLPSHISQFRREPCDRSSATPPTPAITPGGNTETETVEWRNDIVTDCEGTGHLANTAAIAYSPADHPIAG